MRWMRFFTDRPSRKGVELFDALDKIEASAGTHFDPKVVVALKKTMREDGLDNPMPAWTPADALSS